jgi:ABC-type Zn uptake system ZnuABC Zn-binding protein ZnuA/ABC-type Mn2+/Zn2+ transport system permease subunit
VFESFELPYVQRGLIEVLILAVSAGVLGTWIVLRGLAFFSHAVGTAAFPGLVLADGIGFSASVGAFGAAAVFTLAIWALTRRRGTAYDSLTALVLVGCLAAGVILASDVYHSGSNVEQLLFGSLLLVDDADIRLAAAIGTVVIVSSLLLGRHWLATGFDEAPDSPGRSESWWLDIALLVVIALATTAALTVIGALLVSALLVAPAATTRLFVNRMAPWQLATIALAAVEGVVGLWLSVETNAPPGATIAALSGGVFCLAGVARAIGPRRGALAATAAATLALLGAGCGGSGSDGVSVVATTTQIGDWTRAVGGDAVDVHQILSPNTDPHDYEPRPDDVADTADAKVVLTSGNTLDSWIDEVVSDSGSDAEVVDLGANVPVKLPGETEGEESSKFDPHWWHDLRNAEVAVREIEAQLSEIDPDERATFEANADAYLAKLRTLDSGIKSCIDSVPVADRKLVTDHDAFGYFANRYGIQVVGAVIPSQTTQAQPSAKDLSDLADLVRRERVKAVFPESSLSPKLADAIASQTGASANYTLYGDTLGPGDSSGDTYLHMEEANANAIVEGFTDGQRGCEIVGLD